MRVVLSVPCLLLAMSSLTNGYPNGPPESSCESMYPTGHKVDAQTSDPPFEILVSSNNVVLGQDVTVTLRLKDNADPSIPYFEGVFVQARLASCGSTKPVGTFTVPANDPFLRVMNCHEERPMSAVSHKTHTHEKTKTFTWTPPASEPGRIYFRATVVKNTTTFWTDVFSNYLEDSTDTSPVPTSYCDVQTTVGAASSLSALTSLLFAAFVISFQFL